LFIGCSSWLKRGGDHTEGRQGYLLVSWFRAIRVIDSESVQTVL
jgi:hypothetical protein